MKKLKIAVYTAVFENYDIIMKPKLDQNNIEFFCFTNPGTIVPRPWKTITKNFTFSGNAKVDTIKLKCLGHEILKDYDVLIWVDGNIVITGELRPYIERIILKGDLFTNLHRSRDCIYSEANICMNLQKVDNALTITQMSRYRDIGFPKNFGLHETTIIIRDMRSEKIMDFNILWWKEFLSGGYRDQLSFDYVRWKLNFDVAGLEHDYFGNSKMFFKLIHIPKFLKNKINFWLMICNLRVSNNFFKSYLGRILISFCYRLGSIL
jgi:hypothetical protein